MVPVKKPQGNTSEIPWFEKYRPKSAKDMVGFDSIIKKIQQFLRNFEEKSGKIKRAPVKKASKKGSKRRTGSTGKELLSTKERAILLEGPPGVGKTSVVYAIANDLGYSVLELNASDVRTEAEINKKLYESVSTTNLMSFMPRKEKTGASTSSKSASSSSSPSSSSSKSNQSSGGGGYRKKKLILIDEVDGISGQSDRGGLATLLKIIKITKNPIIMTCNFYDTKFKSLYDKVEKIKCNPLRTPSIIRVLKNIANKEGINIDEKVLKIIAENSAGDLRSAINDLQGLVQQSSPLSMEDINKVDLHRDVQEKIFTFIGNMFQQDTVLEAREVASNTDLDYNFLYKVIFSNIPNFITNLEDMQRAMKILAETDALLGKIKKKMDFSLLPYYFDLTSAGVVFSIRNPKLGGYKRFITPKYYSTGSSYNEDPLASALQSKYHWSKAESMHEVLPLIKRLISNADSETQSELLERFAEDFGLDVKAFKKYVL
ncbi:MAG: AAA family ATPase [Promethearchaeota archaeon]